MSIGPFEKLQHIPGNLDGYMHEKGCVHSQEGSEKVFHLWLTSRLCRSRKLSTKAKTELTTA